MRSNLESQGAATLERSRLADYVTLTKPELTFLSVLTALTGLFLGTSGTVPGMLLLHTLVGTALVGGGAGALNQYIERRHDALMKRTENRPLPSGRLMPLEVLLFGALISGAGVLQLFLFVNPLTGFLSVITWTTYLFLYTPLKRISPLATLVGAIPGALPPVMGWTAARNDIGVEAGILFGILFLWQMPHFLSLAWMYRKDYARAGYRLLTVFDENGSRTSTHILLYTLALVPISLLGATVGHFGVVYLLGATSLGAAFLVTCIRLHLTRSNTAARRVFITSLVYLPALIIMMVIASL